jgi:hypothetical protein
MSTQDRIFDNPKHQAEYEKIVRDAIKLDKSNNVDFRKRVEEATSELEGNSLSTTDNLNEVAPNNDSSGEGSAIGMLIMSLFFMIGLVGQWLKMNRGVAPQAKKQTGQNKAKGQNKKR